MVQQHTGTWIHQEHSTQGPRSCNAPIIAPICGYYVHIPAVELKYIFTLLQLCCLSLEVYLIRVLPLVAPSVDLNRSLEYVTFKSCSSPRVDTAVTWPRASAYRKQQAQRHVTRCQALGRRAQGRRPCRGCPGLPWRATHCRQLSNKRSPFHTAVRRIEINNPTPVLII